MKQFDSVDISLLKKYSRPGPRYTSYPTAPAFTEAFGPDQYREAIEQTNQPGSKAPISLYFHFPFCDTLCYFCGCTMLVTHSRDQIREYNEYLKREISAIAPLIAEGRPVIQLHWGGGTPSYLDPDEIRDVGNFIQNHFSIAQDVEAGVEIDPRGLTFDHMRALRDVGFNRVSMGIQDFDLRVQEAVNRIQPESISRDAIGWSRELGFGSINLDLIYGLPHQTLSSFEATVEKVIALSPDRLAVFNYAHVPWMKPHQKIINAEDLPDADLKLELFKMTTEKLLNAGYWSIGMDHFAKQTDELALAQRNGTLYRNFQGYSTQAGCDLYGFGLSAIGHFQETYHQNVKSIPSYYGKLRENSLATHVGYRMTPDDHIRKEVIMKIMCDMEVRKQPIEERFGIRFDEYFSQAIHMLAPFVDDGLVSLFPEKIVVHGMGRLVIRNVAMCFDAYLDKMMQEQRKFSKTV